MVRPPAALPSGAAPRRAPEATRRPPREPRVRRGALRDRLMQSLPKTPCRQRAQSGAHPQNSNDLRLDKPDERRSVQPVTVACLPGRAPSGERRAARYCAGTPAFSGECESMQHRVPLAVRCLVVAVAALGVCAIAVMPAAGGVTLPPGAVKPPPGSGIGTAAALNNPLCAHDEPSYGVYGRFNSTTVGGGAGCVKPGKAGPDNGGATGQGVTRTAIKVFAVVPNEQQINSPGGTAPTNRAGNTRGTYQDAVHDT